MRRTGVEAACIPRDIQVQGVAPRAGLEVADGVRETLEQGLAATSLEPADIDVVHVGNFAEDLGNVSAAMNRFPNMSVELGARIGELGVKSGVRLTRVQYAQGPPGSDFTEISMDAGITGDYPQIMRFVNDLERDRNFFVSRALSLTGQQGGMVNLRLRVSTWLRPADAAASGLPLTPQPGDVPAAASTPSNPQGRGGN